MKKHIIGTICVFLITYLLAAFVANDIDAGMWDIEGRYLYVFISMIFSILLAGARENI